MKSMGCASAAATWEAAVAGVKLDNNTAGGGSGVSDGGGINRTGKPFVAGVRLDNKTYHYVVLVYCMGKCLCDMSYMFIPLSWVAVVY